MKDVMRALGRTLCFVIALPLLAAACDNPFAQSDLERERDRLADARRRWEIAGIDSYEFTVHRTCFCPNAPIRTRVVDGVVVSRTYVESGEPVPAGHLEGLDTVEELLQFVERALDERPAESDVDYESRGIPVTAWFDFSLNVADDEGGFSAGDFTPIQS